MEAEIISLPTLPPVASNGRIRLLREDMFDVALARERLPILKLIVFGVTRASALSEKLHIPKSTLYRHLNTLMRAGWIERKGDGDYVLASNIFLVYKILANEENVMITIMNNKGAFIDRRTGLIIVTGRQPPVNCMRCRELQKCTEIAKNVAKSIGIKLRSLTPAEAFVEIMTHMARKILQRGLAQTYIELKTRNEMLEST